jgi:putative molybdopterin biosynthesis protein
MTRREFRNLSDPAAVEEAIDTFELATGRESVELSAARGRVLAERIDAPIDVPGFDRAAMDGYAVRARDTFGATETDPIELSVTGTVHAGEEPAEEIDAGQALQIATGAVLPPGADAVVPVERTTEGETAVDVRTAVTPGDSVMPRGADIASGARAIGPGTLLDPRHIGLLGAVGRECVPVVGQPRVGIVSTGAELVQPGNGLRPEAGEIYDVNTHALTAAVESAGGDPQQFTTASDDPATMRASLAEAAEETDLLLTSGSTSAGTADVLYDLIEEHGEVLVHGVALKPGRPLLVGRVFGTPYVGLPGYPVSAMTVFRVFVAPRLRAAVGQPEPAAATVDATIGTRYRYDGGRLRLLPVGLVEDGEGSLVAHTLAKGSGATTTLAEADGVVQMDPERTLLSKGDETTVELFDPDAPLPSLLVVGAADPVAFDLFDTLAAPRHLALGRMDAQRWFTDGIPDLLIATGSSPVDGDVLGRWRREWGLAVRDGTTLDGLADLPDCQFANLDEDVWLRDAFETALTDAGVDGEDIEGYHRELPGLESAARSVASGRADAGLALCRTADSLDVSFVGLGEQDVSLVAAQDRREKDGLVRLEAAIDEFEFDDVVGYTAGDF